MSLKQKVKLNHYHDEFLTLNCKNHEQYNFLALKQPHSIEIMNTIVLGAIFNLFQEKSPFMSFNLENIMF